MIQDSVEIDCADCMVEWDGTPDAKAKVTIVFCVAHAMAGKADFVRGASRVMLKALRKIHALGEQDILATHPQSSVTDINAVGDALYEAKRAIDVAEQAGVRE